MDDQIAPTEKLDLTDEERSWVRRFRALTSSQQKLALKHLELWEEMLRNSELLSKLESQF